MMVPRITIELSVVNAAMLQGLWPVLATLALVPAAGVAWVTLRQPPSDVAHDVKLTNPLQLRTAVVFGLMLSVLFIGGRALEVSLGDAGVYAMAAVAGLVDVDAITLALAERSKQELSLQTAQRGVVIAVLVNTAVKAVLAAALGGLPMLRSASLILAVALVAGTAVGLVVLA